MMRIPIRFAGARALAGGLVALLGLLAPASSGADPLPRSAARVADYEISVQLDPDSKSITGRERLVWRNPSSDAVPDLWFHLYLNAFRNNRSTFHRESGGKLRGDSAPVDGWGWIDVTELRLLDGAAGVDLLPSLRYEHPDDDNGDDRTVARVELPEPALPGAEVVLDIAWTARLP